MEHEQSCSVCRFRLGWGLSLLGGSGTWKFPLQWPYCGQSNEDKWCHTASVRNASPENLVCCHLMDAVHLVTAILPLRCSTTPTYQPNNKVCIPLPSVIFLAQFWCCADSFNCRFLFCWILPIWPPVEDAFSNETKKERVKEREKRMKNMQAFISLNRWLGASVYTCASVEITNQKVWAN